MTKPTLKPSQPQPIAPPPPPTKRDQFDLPPDTKTEIATAIAIAKSTQISTPEQAIEVGETIKTVKRLAKQIKDYFAPMKKQANELLSLIRKREQAELDPLDSAEGTLKGRLLRYNQAALDQARAIEREKQAQAEQFAAAERARLLALAQQETDNEKMMETLAEAKKIVAPVVRVEPEAPKQAGFTTRRIWKHRVVDAAAVPREFLVIDESKLAKYATAMKEQASVPGVEFFPEETLAVRV